MDHIKRVRRLSKALTQCGHVTVTDDFVKAVANLTALCGPIEPAPQTQHPISLAAFTAELCYSAVNFCYWDGSCANRPAGGSIEARGLVFYHFEVPMYPDGSPAATAPRTERELVTFLETTAQAFRKSSFPLATERASLIDELIRQIAVVRTLWERCVAGLTSAEYDLTLLLSAFPGFGGDPLLKRAFFFFCMLDRVYGQASETAKLIPLPADYQVPKVLRGAGVITYSDELSRLIETETPLIAGSVIESAIRGSAIEAVRLIADTIGRSESEVDEWLWCSRNKVPGKFHLCRTTNY